MLAACAPLGAPPRASSQLTTPFPSVRGGTETAVAPIHSPTPSPLPSLTPSLTPTVSPTPSFTPTASPSATPSPVPTVESLKATVTADLLSCRYGPGAHYLYLVALRRGARLTLIGWTGSTSWVWVRNSPFNCWVNAKFLEIQGDFRTLPVVYPHIAKLPITPYYPPTAVLSATRQGNTVTVSWMPVKISPGDYENERMFNYIVEVWRCEGGQILFDSIPSNYELVSFVDEPGCAEPSRGRVWVQEKHGYAGPAEIPWP